MPYQRMYALHSAVWTISNTSEAGTKRKKVVALWAKDRTWASPQKKKKNWRYPRPTDKTHCVYHQKFGRLFTCGVYRFGWLNLARLYPTLV